MKKKVLINGAVIMLALSPVFYLWVEWNSIPATFITRFRLNEEIDKIQSRETLLTATIVISLTTIFIYLLMRNLKEVDPNVTPATPVSAFNRLGLVISFFLVVINYYIILSVVRGWQISTNLVFAFCGVFVACMGNYMNNIKPNFFAGIRLPWTLKDQDNWRKTHHLAAKLWFTAGILLCLVSFIIPAEAMIHLFAVLLIVIVLIPGIYSYRLYRNKLKQT